MGTPSVASMRILLVNQPRENNLGMGWAAPGIGDPEQGREHRGYTPFSIARPASIHPPGFFHGPEEVIEVSRGADRI